MKGALREFRDLLDVAVCCQSTAMLSSVPYPDVVSTTASAMRRPAAARVPPAPALAAVLDDPAGPSAARGRPEMTSTERCTVVATACSTRQADTRLCRRTVLCVYHCQCWHWLHRHS